ncbi:MAG: Asp-tRNA(Asn)/Glu-tRNA(Gln) amidotransferase subunit GatB, partial [Candidatus Magasanikbacteria bacterium]|nr:Asp-tRNA(Asn)/Glu-tRNA(Gln) amidotransferase subunit GatB [Candidatus Magasanikbacteria bacterium]
MDEPKYIPTIGLEIHAELRTKSKMFCSCANNPDEAIPNKNICPICLAHPGTLPVLNKEAIKHVIKVGVAVDGTIADFTEWDRKNYFYPDIPKGYQISQYKYPLVSGGVLANVTLERIHLEEDTAQSTHDTHEKSLVNFNRSGVPLMELVTKPVIHDSLTAVRFAKELQLLLRYLGAGDANMEKGEMRVEANISIASPSNTANGKFGTKTEVKNLNSFRAVAGAIEFEVKRQSSLLEQGEVVKQETRGWDDKAQETYSQRSKESSHDYRYFPDPDIPKLKLSLMPEFAHDAIKKELPELPWKKRDRYSLSYGMTEKELAVFVESPVISTYFESVISLFAKDQKKVKLAVNYILSDYLGLLKKKGFTISDPDHESHKKDSISTVGPIKPETFSELIELISAGDVSSRGAKDLLVLLTEDATINEVVAGSLKSIAEKYGLIQKSDAGSLDPIIADIITNNPKVVADYKAGKVALLQFL